MATTDGVFNVKPFYTTLSNILYKEKMSKSNPRPGTIKFMTKPKQPNKSRQPGLPSIDMSNPMLILHSSNENSTRKITAKQSSSKTKSFQSPYR